MDIFQGRFVAVYLFLFEGYDAIRDDLGGPKLLQGGYLHRRNSDTEIVELAVRVCEKCRSAALRTAFPTRRWYQLEIVRSIRVNLA